jgi:hypothetical protein
MLAAGLAPWSARGEEDARRYPPRDRSLELVDHLCRTEIGSRRVTLFANGTVRLREEIDGERRLALAELPPDHLEGVLQRFLAEDLSEADTDRLTPEGDWIDRCLLRLHIREGVGEQFSHGPFDSLPLSLSRVLSVVAELAEMTRDERSEALPRGYRPQVGDILRRADDVLFEVVGWTSDGKGVELQGVEQPLTLFIRPEDLRSKFTGPIPDR